MKRTFLSFTAALALAIFVNSSAYGVITTITETFDDDPTLRGWSGVGNDPLPGPGQGVPPEPDYGFRNSDNTGTAVDPPWGVGVATAEGEIGGAVNRGPDSFYGVDLGGPIDFGTTDMNVQGVIKLESAGGSTTLNLGWTQGITSVIGDGDDPTQFLGISFDDGTVGELTARSTGGIGSDTGPNLVSGGPTIPFEMDWVAATGTLTVDLNGSSASLVIGPGDGGLAPLTHWGLFGRTNTTPDNANVVWLDDIRFTAERVVIPEPSTLLLVICSALGLVARRRVR